jgi:hypothetical protein
MNSFRWTMDRVLIRFSTRFPFKREPHRAAALIVYGARIREIVRRVLGLRERIRIRGRGLKSPTGYLLNDGSVLAAEFLRDFPDLPLGHASFAPFDQPADDTLEIVTDVGSPTLRWEFILNGVPVDERLTPCIAIAEGPDAG